MLFLFCFSEVVNAQDTWQRIYQSRYNLQNHSRAICPADFENFYSSGAVTGPAIGASMCVTKLNKYGDTIWNKIVGGSNSGEDGLCIVKSIDNGCVVSGRSDTVYCVKLNSNGVIVWKRFYDRYSGVMNSIINTSDGGYLVCGSLDSRRGYILKIDSLGYLQWDKLFITDFMRQYYHSVQTENGYILCGFVASSSGYYNGIITKLDMTGQTVLWEKNYTINGKKIVPYKIIKNNTNLYWIFGDYEGSSTQNRQAIIKINDSGAVIDSMPIQSSNIYSDSFKDCIKVTDNKFAMIVNKFFTVSSFDSVKSEVRLIDSNGVILNYRIFDHLGTLELKSVTNFLNGGFIIGGYVDFGGLAAQNEFVAPENLRTFFARLDSNLNCSALSAINNSEVIIKDFQLYQNYPNPFNPSTLIKFSIPKNGIVTFKVYNSTGEEIHSSNKFYYGGTNQFEYSPENLSSGIYFYSLQFGNNIQTSKMVFVK